VYGPVCRLAWEERKRLRREVLSGRNALDALHLSPMPTIVTDREDDGRWIGEVPILPGVLAYGATEAEARRNVLALAFHVIGDRIAHGEPVPDGASPSYSPHSRDSLVGMVQPTGIA